jgi:hypothetical protein
MCLNCGCGQPDKRHKETDLVREDVQRAADGQGSPIEETVRNLESSLRELRSGSGATAGSGSASYGGSTPR